MREYDDYSDDSIRLYTPVLQRVIILAAVVIAVPVLMWTITTFVRSYVARPRVPALEHVASTTPSTRLPLTAAPPGPTPSVQDQSDASRIGGSSAGDTPPSGAMQQGTGNLASLPGSGGATPIANSPSAALSAAPLQAPSPASAASAAAATSEAAPASLPRPSLSLPQAPNDSAALSPARSSSDRGIAWPNPNATSAPDFGGPRLASPAAPPPRPATADVVPAGEPLSGPVPLPRHRPSIFAMAGAAAGSTAGATTGTIASPGPIATGRPVPLPRVRPADAPVEATNSVVEPAYGYRPGLDADR
jgi:hypothetical protein